MESRDAQEAQRKKLRRRRRDEADLMHRTSFTTAKLPLPSVCPRM
jgi:hypothetical protein